MNDKHKIVSERFDIFIAVLILLGIVFAYYIISSIVLEYCNKKNHFTQDDERDLIAWLWPITLPIIALIKFKNFIVTSVVDFLVNPRKPKTVMSSDNPYAEKTLNEQ